MGQPQVVSPRVSLGPRFLTPSDPAVLFGDGSETGGVGWVAQVVLSGSGGVSFGAGVGGLSSISMS